MSTPQLSRLPAVPPQPAITSRGAQTRTIPGIREWRIAATILIIVSVAQLTLTVRLNAHNDLEMLNRYFDSDNAWYLVNFETGDQKFGSYGGRNFVHPNVANFIHPLVLLASGVLGRFDHESKAGLTRKVSLAVAPVCAGIRSGLLFVALTVAGFSLADALLVTTLGTVAFSSVLFGCLPESFVISSATFAAYFFVAARTAADGELRSLSWILVGTMLSSITITNLAAFAIGLALLLTFILGDLFKAAKKTVYLSAAALLVTMVCFFALTAAHGSFKGVGRKIGQLEEVRFNPASMFVNFPKTVARSIVGQLPNQLTGTDEEHKSTKVQVVRFTYRDDLESIKQTVATIISYERLGGHQALEWLTFALIATGILISSRVLVTGSRAIKIVFLLSLSQILFHWILHSFFGLELFLYSQHWIVPLVIAIGCGLTLSSPYKWASRFITLILIASAVWQSATVMRTLMRL